MFFGFITPEVLIPKFPIYTTGVYISTPEAAAPSVVLSASSMGALSRSSNIRSFSNYASMVSSFSTRSTTDTGMGTAPNFLLVMRFSVFKQRKVYLPWKLEVGPRKIDMLVCALSMVFVVFLPHEPHSMYQIQP